MSRVTQATPLADQDFLSILDASRHAQTSMTIAYESCMRFPAGTLKEEYEDRLLHYSTTLNELTERFSHRLFHHIPPEERIAFRPFIARLNYLATTINQTVHYYEQLRCG